MITIKKKDITDSYEFTTEEERLLAKVTVPYEAYKLNEGDLWILGPTPKIYRHTKSVLSYDTQTQRLCGRYSLSWFEVLGVFESEEDVLQYLSASQTKEDMQLSLFDML
ncbi:hypothetical protein [Virgibacillus halodenitrificans]|uniref:hypothetical protein n=1 Tax=Virgibacillus halodenitrificans TaxID=1482 RepID=UPI000EF54CCA|nr:hypothetical protein [Virgibacillus halodenitrificans]